MKAIAQRADISEKGLLHHFAGREDLLVSVVAERDKIVADLPQVRDAVTLPEMIVAVAEHNQTEPALGRLYLDLVVASGDPELRRSEFFVNRYAQLRSGVENRLVRLGASPAVARWQASVLVAAADGVQLQTLVEPSGSLVESLVELATMFEDAAVGSGDGVERSSRGS